eukprot:3419742-Alexandrium_andersonii.AAC.1
MPPYLGCPLTAPGGDPAAPQSLASGCRPVCDKVASRPRATIQACAAAGARAAQWSTFIASWVH